MLSFPGEFLSIRIRYAALFSKPVFAHVRFLMVGARQMCHLCRVVDLGMNHAQKLPTVPPGTWFINLPYKVNLHVAWRKEYKSPIIKNVLQQVQETALKYGLEENS